MKLQPKALLLAHWCDNWNSREVKIQPWRLVRPSVTGSSDRLGNGHWIRTGVWRRKSKDPHQKPHDVR